MKRAAAAGAACVGAPLRCYPAEPGRFPAELAAVLTAICPARNPRTGSELAASRGRRRHPRRPWALAGQIAATHQALDQRSTAPGRLWYPLADAHRRRGPATPR